MAKIENMKNTVLGTNRAMVIHCWLGAQISATTLENSGIFLLKLTICLYYDLIVSFLDLYPREMGTELPNDMYKNVNSSNICNNPILVVAVTIKNSSAMVTKQNAA